MLTRFVAVLAVTTLGACGVSLPGGISTDKSGGSLPPSPTAAAASSTGPGATDTVGCNAPYGNPPAEVSSFTSGNGAGAIAEILDLTNQCILVGGETLSWTDANSDTRTACLLTPPNASATSKLPLMVFLQGSLFPATPQLYLNQWNFEYRSADLSGDPARPGFILLMPIGRNTHHFYPYPDDYALGFDNWYRNLDRGSPDLNVDVAAIDQFISQVQSRGIVDDNRLYLTGWSNGGAMAELYALNTPSIAAAAVYSAPAPFSDWHDPCYQSPFITTPTPIMDVHNACDIIGTCQTSSAFHTTLGSLFPQVPQSVVILDNARNQTSECSAACASDTIAGDPFGNLNHVIWPNKWDAEMFKWLREHPLSAKK